MRPHFQLNAECWVASSNFEQHCVIEHLIPVGEAAALLRRLLPEQFLRLVAFARVTTHFLPVRERLPELVLEQQNSLDSLVELHDFHH